MASKRISKELKDLQKDPPVSCSAVVKEVTMNQKEEVPKKISKPQLIQVDNAFKLAEQLVKNMSRSSDDQSSKVLKYQPPRLGVGASVSREVHVVPKEARKQERINFKKQERINFEGANDKFIEILTENE